MKKRFLACMLVLWLIPISSLAEIDYQPYNYDKAITSPSTYRDILITVTGTVVASTDMADGGFAFFIDVDDILNDTVLCILYDNLEQVDGLDIGCSVTVLGIASGDSTEYGLPISYPIINVIAVSNLGQLRADQSARDSGHYIPYDYNEARHYSKYYRDTPVLLRGKVTDTDGTTYKVQIPDKPLWYIYAYCDSNVSTPSVSVGDYIDINGSAAGLTSDLGLDYDVPVIKADSITKLGSKYPGDLEPENHIDTNGSTMTVYPGLYEVGKDIPSGTYMITAPDMRFSFARHGQNLRKDSDGYTVESDDTSDLICVYHENSSRYRSGERPTQIEYTVRDGYYFEAYHAPVILTPIQN